MEALEPFYPDRMASRILGEGPPTAWPVLASLPAGACQAGGRGASLFDAMHGRNLGRRLRVSSCMRSGRTLSEACQVADAEYSANAPSPTGLDALLAHMLQAWAMW